MNDFDDRRFEEAIIDCYQIWEQTGQIEACIERHPEFEAEIRAHLGLLSDLAAIPLESPVNAAVHGSMQTFLSKVESDGKRAARRARRRIWPFVLLAGASLALGIAGASAAGLVDAPGAIRDAVEKVGASAVPTTAPEGATKVTTFAEPATPPKAGLQTPTPGSDPEQLADERQSASTQHPGPTVPELKATSTAGKPVPKASLQAGPAFAPPAGAAETSSSLASGAPGQSGTNVGQGGTPPGQSGSNPGQGGTPPGQSGSNPGQGGTPPGQSGSNPGQGGTPPGQSGNNAGQGGTPPGQSGNNAGQGGTPPGQSGSNPGQGGTPPGQSGNNAGQRGTPPGQSGSNPAQGGTPPGQTKSGR